MTERLSKILKISCEGPSINIIGLDAHDNIMELEFTIVASL